MKNHSMKKFLYITAISVFCLASNAISAETSAVVNTKTTRTTQTLKPMEGADASLMENQTRFQQQLVSCTPFSFKYTDPSAPEYTAKKSILGRTKKGRCKTTEVMKATSSQCEFTKNSAKTLSELATKKNVSQKEIDHVNQILRNECTTKLKK